MKHFNDEYCIDERKMEVFEQITDSFNLGISVLQRQSEVTERKFNNIYSIYFRYFLIDYRK